MEQPPTTTERWQQVKRHFQTVLELPAAERAVHLSRVCASDAELRAEVESLLAAHEEPGSFLDRPLGNLAAGDLAAEDGELTGRMLGHYLILGLLSRGGMGEVYQAKDTRLGREVAIKVLPAAFAADRERLLRFEREARAVSALNHPNILTIHEFGHEPGENGVYFIVTELIVGETLRRRLARETPAREAMLNIASQIASALQTAHAAGIVHRDLKPENVMIRPDGLVKVLDFGLAKPAVERTDGETASGVVMGTMAYMSPEQARGQRLDARTDLFSLGVMLYEMAAGQSPFARETPADTLAAILEKEPPPLPPDVSAPLAALINKALNKDRAARPQSAAELLTELKRLQHGAASASNSERLRVKLKLRSIVIATILLVSAAMLAVIVYRNRTRPAVASIAVLPFTNAGGNAETEYLADGVTEGLINSLIRLSELKVRPRNAVFRYKKSDVDPQAAGRALDVETVLTGQIALRNGELTINVQLTDVRENRQLWGEKFSGRATELLPLQARLARTATEKLRLRLSAGEDERLARVPTTDPAAYELYLQGRSYWNLRTRDGYRRAQEFFTQAIAGDPNFALPHAGLADYYVLGGAARTSPHETMPKARAAALRALQLDGALGEAHASLAQVQLFYDWNFAAAETSFQRALALNPAYETAHHWYAVLLALAGRFPEAADRIARALTLDPGSSIINKDAALIEYYAGRYEQAATQCRKTLALAPDFYPAHSLLGNCYLQLGSKEEAIAELQKADALADGRLLTKAELGYAYAAAGKREQALNLLAELRSSPSGTAFYQALLYAGLGERERAFDQLEQAVRERAYRITQLNVDPAFAGLRADERFRRILQQSGFAPFR